MLKVALRFSRGPFTLQLDTSFAAPVTGIYGESGSGKSTLLGLIAGLLKPDTGLITLDEQVLVDTAARVFLPPQRRHIGLVFQDGQLFPHLSVQQNLLYGWRHLTEAERHFTLQEVTAMLEIEHLLARLPQQLSGGEKQRVALGRAILYSPKLLLLDEPLSSLDDRRKQQILPFLRRVRDETAIPMLYVSHSLSEIEYLTEDVFDMNQARVAQDAC